MATTQSEQATLRGESDFEGEKITRPYESDLEPEKAGTDAVPVEDEKAKDQPPAAAGAGPGQGAAPGAAPAGPPMMPGGPPPDGGLQAWLQVVGGFMLFFNTWGILNTFGVYQTYYESGALFHASSSNISWIGSIQAFCVVFSGIFAGPLYDRGFLRGQLIVGSFLVVFGHMMLSLCHTQWQAILAQGFCIGLGGGCLFTPAVALLPTYFHKKLGLAVGLAASGSSLGGIIYPIMFYKLINEVGFGWGVRILGFTVLATQSVPLLFLKMRFKPPRARKMIDLTAFSDGPFLLLVLGCILGFIGLYVGLFYISYFSQAEGLTDASLSFYLVPILNAASCFGRTVPNWISDKTGALNMLIPGAMICGIIILSMIATHTMGGIIVIALAFGFFSGVFIALPSVIVVQLTKDRSKIGTRIGMAFAMVGGGVLAGGPGAGAILGENVHDLHWRETWIFGGVCFMGAFLVLSLVRFWIVGGKLMTKV